MTTGSIHRALRSVVLVPMVLASPATAQSDSIEVVDNDPFEITEGPIKAELVSIRPLAIVGTPGQRSIGRIRLTKDLIVESALQFEEIQNAVAALEKSPQDMELGEWKKLINNSGYTSNHLFVPGRVSQFEDLEGKVVESNIASSPPYKMWDATTITNMVATGIIDVENTKLIEYQGTSIETAGISSEYSEKLAEVYSRLPHIEQQPVAELSVPFQQIQDVVRQYDSLAQSMLKRLGDITFGQPLVYASSEKDLVLPEAIAKEYDVYWIELAVTFREMNPDDLDEMAINFAVPDDAIALELIPLQYSQEFAVSKDVGVPEVGVEYGGAKITVGEFFRKTVAYSYLKPTIVAYGLREAKFSWVIRDEAIRAGSHKFIAVLGVPKGRERVDIAMSGHVRLKKGVLGGLLSGGEIAGTDAQVVPVSF